MISGLVFGDDNADSIHEAGETGVWQTGNWMFPEKFRNRFTPIPTVSFLLAGSIPEHILLRNSSSNMPWRQTFPSFASYVLTIGVNDSVTGINFGDAYPWNSIDGTVYLDVNENGMKGWI